MLDAVLEDPQLGPRADQERISVIGHSLGGSTALLLSGGVFDPPQLVEACGDDTRKLLCIVYRAGGLSKTMAPVTARDPRISAAVLLDMEGIHAFTPASLAQLAVPVLALVSGVEDPALPLGWEGRTQARPVACRHQPLCRNPRRDALLLHERLSGGCRATAWRRGICLRRRDRAAT